MNVDTDLFKNHPSWPAVQHVCQILWGKGHEALLAGGAVRDGILKRVPKDFDVATNATPDQVESYFPKTLDVGKAFGVIMVNVEGFSIEVTSFRKDGPYTDGRHPESIELSSAKEDASRRDFTINALFYDLKTNKLIDYVKGIDDLKRKLIRTVGQPSLRFQEDRLRTLRAIRFAAELDFEIEPQTWTSILVFRNRLTEISKERITEEIRKLLLSKNPLKGILLMKESQYLEELWPSLTFVQSEYYTKQLFRAFHIIAGDRRLELFLASLILFETYFKMEHVGVNYRAEVDVQISKLSEFRFQKDVIRSVTYCLRAFPEVKKMNTKSLVLLDDPNGLTLLDLLNVFTLARGEGSENLERFKNTFLDLCDENGHLPQRWINGETLESLAFPHGPMYSDVIEKAYLKQLDNDFENKEQALAWVKTYISGLR